MGRKRSIYGEIQIFLCKLTQTILHMDERILQWI
jgi:hypothetical protein